ncbi:MAG TPA: hypothetical protein VF041_18770 [Gemmatimonadaceae bacterium]
MARAEVVRRRRRRRAARAAAGVVLAAWAIAPAAVRAQSLAYTGALQGSTGEYIFTERSFSLALYNGLSLSLGRLRLSASLPVVLQNTPWVTLGGTGPVPTGGPQHEMTGEQMGGGGMGEGGQGRRGGSVVLPDTGGYDEVGVGDPMLFASIELFGDRGSRPAVAITGAVKAPVADAAQGFGTGEWDYSAGFSLSKSVGRALLFLDGSYWMLGDMSGLPLRDVFSYGVSLGVPFGRGGGGAGASWSAIVSFSGSQAAIAGSDAPAEAGVLVSRLSPSGRSLAAGVSLGLTRSSPDVSAMIGWRVPLWSREAPIAALRTPYDNEVNRSVER